MISGSYYTVNVLFDPSFLTCDCSVFVENRGYIMYKYNILMFVWNRDLSHLMFYLKQTLKIHDILSIDNE